MTYAIKAPARYAQGAGELANLGRSAKKLGNKFLVICTDNSRGRFGAQVEASLAEQEKEVVFTTFHGEATKDEVFAKMDECRAQGCDVVVGMGGGKALDTAKAVAENLGLPCVIIPTVASNDAPCSGVAVLYNDAGVVIKAVLMRRNPDLVLVDTGIIANAPRRLFAAGLGDYETPHKVLIMTTQVTYEGSDVGVYEVGKRVKNRFRFLEAHDMTIEAVVTKSMWLLAQDCDSFDQLQQRFYRQVNFDTFYH